MATPSYDKTSAESILAYARTLLGKTLHDVYPEAGLVSGGKGGLGQSVEKYHFGYEPNSISDADFSEAGVELKCTPLKTIQDGSMVAKERLVLNLINYFDELDKDFWTSSFSRKNALLLLMFYLHQKGVHQMDLLFKIIRLWSIPEEDLKIFIDDWNYIHNKIVTGQAHELSEGDTLYLAACTKGANSDSKVAQPKSGVLAKQRAYSIKPSYLNSIIVESLQHPEMCDGVAMTPAKAKKIKQKKQAIGHVVRSVTEYQTGETFEQLVARRFSPFIGLSVREIEKRLRVKISKSPKAMSYSVCRAILGVKERKIAEFEKANIRLKSVRLEPTGRLKEAMSFQTIKYHEIINEEHWEDSDWYNTIATQKLMFIVFRKNANKKDRDAVLEKAFFWSMPMRDIELAADYWKDTRDKVLNNDYDHFIKASDKPHICHVRPKAKNASVLVDTPQGGKTKQYCYWLNRDYILNIVNSH